MAKIEITTIDPGTEVIALINGTFIKCVTTNNTFVTIKEGKVEHISYEVNIPDEKYETLNKTVWDDNIFLTKEDAMKAVGLDSI